VSNVALQGRSTPQTSADLPNSKRNTPRLACTLFIVPLALRGERRSIFTKRTQF
jgi:hypothetical protein